MRRITILVWLLLLCIVGLYSRCYTFKGISIDPNIQTFSVKLFENTASNAPPTIAVDFTERLKDKVRTETPLRFKPDEADAEFSGKITDFSVVPVAPKPNETVAFNRLNISIRVNYIINKEGVRGSWPNERDFTFFADFSNSNDLLTIQNELIRQISNQLLEDIFNAAFNDW
jgi:Lipopolysaccharide-assembly